MNFHQQEMMCAYVDFSLGLSPWLFLSFAFAFCPVNKAKPKKNSGSEGGMICCILVLS